MGSDVGRSYDRVAVQYADQIGDELASKPLDRAALNAFAEMTQGLVLDVGGGPGQVALYLAQQGVAVASTDVSHAMCGVARRAGLPSATADMTQLPFASGALGGIVCFYAVIHLDSGQRAVAYASFGRVLHAGGLVLLAFHTRDADHPMGAEAEVSSWWDQPVSLTFRYLDPAIEAEALAATGFEVIARLDRSADGAEHASDRTYLLARKLGSTAGLD